MALNLQIFVVFFLQLKHPLLKHKENRVSLVLGRKCTWDLHQRRAHHGLPTDSDSWWPEKKVGTKSSSPSSLLLLMTPLAHQGGRMQPQKALKHSDRSNGLAKKTHTPKIVFQWMKHPMLWTPPPHRWIPFPPEGKAAVQGTPRYSQKNCCCWPEWRAGSGRGRRAHVP